METTALKARIAGWLTATQDVEIPLGLDAKEARTRAQALLLEIQERELNPEPIPLDNDLKQVLSVLISLLAESKQPPELRLKEANAVYQFIRRLPWPSDPFGEQQDLLRECAELGWGAVGLSAAEIGHNRHAQHTDVVPRRKTDPTPSVRYLQLPEEAKTDEARNRTIGDTDTLTDVFEILREQREASPSTIVQEASAIYCWLRSYSGGIGLFDEHDHFLGEAAFMVGNASRVLGRRRDALKWLDRAESSFGHVLNPAPCISNVAYSRLALSYEIGLYEDVLKLLPTVRINFERLKMKPEEAKCKLLEAMTLKATGEIRQALQVLEPVRAWEAKTLDPSLRSRILSEIGDLLLATDMFDDAIVAYHEALGLLTGSVKTQALADLKLFVGDAYRYRGHYETALGAFRAAAEDCQELGLKTRVAYLRIIIADTLLKMNRSEEAEQEILAALPTIEEQKMVPEGFAAVALLKESIRRRKADPNALRELREHLQKNK